MYITMYIMLGEEIRRKESLFPLKFRVSTLKNTTEYVPKSESQTEKHESPS